MVAHQIGNVQQHYYLLKLNEPKDQKHRRSGDSLINTEASKNNCFKNWPKNCHTMRVKCTYESTEDEAAYKLPRYEFSANTTKFCEKR